MFKILHQNKNYVICLKPVNISSQASDGNEDMLSLISMNIGIPKESVYPVHRLDSPVGGTMIYAVSKHGASGLCKLISDNMLTKQYLAVVHGRPEQTGGIFEDLLFKDSKKCKSFVVNRMRKGVKHAKLEYTLLQSTDTPYGTMSLVKIRLHTGRTHQIRVQFSSRKMPLVGDRRYGSGKDDCNVALWSYKLDFVSPFDNKHQSFSTLPNFEEYPWNLFEPIID